MTPPIILTEEIIALGLDWAKRCQTAIPNRLCHNPQETLFFKAICGLCHSL